MARDRTHDLLRLKHADLIAELNIIESHKLSLTSFYQMDLSFSSNLSELTSSVT